MKRLWAKFLCAIGRHPTLDVIQSFGAAQHLGCRCCRNELAIHHGLRTVLPWDAELEELYTAMGYDIHTRRKDWNLWADRKAKAHG